MTHTLIPRSSACSAKVVSSLDFEKFWSCDVIKDYVKSGFTMAAQCPAALAVDISSGIARVNGLYVENTTGDCKGSLIACSVNSIYLTIDRDCCCRPKSWSYSSNTTGSTPTDSMLFGTATTNCATVTSTCTLSRENNPTIVGQVGDQLYPLSTTIGDYTDPCSATSTSSATGCLFHEDLFDCDNYTDNHACIGVNTCCSRFEFIFDTNGSPRNSYDPITAVSDTNWTMRFKLRFSALTSSGGTLMYVGLGSNGPTTILTCGDFIGASFRHTTTLKSYVAIDENCCTICPIVGPNIATTFVTCTDYYAQINRTSATSYTIKTFSCACFATETLTVTDSGLSACTVGLDNITIFNHGGGSAGVQNGIIDTMRIYNNQNPSDLDFGPVFSIDDCTSSQWKSTSENNPAIFVDTGSCQELIALALNIDTCATTETEVDIRLSTDTCFTASEDIRSLLISDFTDNTYRFIQLPRTASNRRYIQIRGVNNSKVLSIHEIKYRAAATAAVDREHFHNFLSPIQTSHSSEDSN